MKTEHLQLRKLEQDDLEHARLLHNLDDVRLNLTDPTEVNQLQQLEWFRTLCSSKSSERWAVYERTDPSYQPEAFVGVFRVDAIDHLNKSVMVGMDVHPTKRMKGYARETYLAFMKHFFEDLGFYRLYLLVLDTNVKAQKLYYSLGFKSEGRQIGAIIRDGKRHDYLMLSILQEDYARQTEQ